MKLWELAKVLADADADDEVVVIDGSGHPHEVAGVRACTPVEGWAKPAPEADYVGRLFIICRARVMP